MSIRTGDIRCGEVLRQAASQIFPRDGQPARADYFDRDRLLKRFSQGERWISLAYQRRDRDGRICQIRHVMNLAQDPLTQDVYLFSYIIGMEARRQLEQELGIPIIRDAVTGLYDRATTRAMVEFQMGRVRSDWCAVAMLQWGGLERLCCEIGCDLSQIQGYFATACAVSLGPACVLGKYDRDKVLVFFSGVSVRGAVKKQLEETFAFIRASLADVLPLDELRFVAGVVCIRPGQAA